MKAKTLKKISAKQAVRRLYHPLRRMGYDLAV
jgi:hypothetical protein